MRPVIDRMMNPGRDGRVIEEGDYEPGRNTRRYKDGDLRVIVWIASPIDAKSSVALVSPSFNHSPEELIRYSLDRRHLDLAPHDAFCSGRMPGYVYADWLEENVPEIDPRVPALLRKCPNFVLSRDSWQTD